MEESELEWRAMKEDLWPSEQEVENVKNEKEEFVERFDKPMLIKEAEDLIKEGEQFKERMNKVKATYENYLKVLEEYQSRFEGWKKHQTFIFKWNEIASKSVKVGHGSKRKNEKRKKDKRRKKIE